MSTPDAMVHSIQVGVFSTIGPADRSVARLLEAGFTTEQLTVVCSGEIKENYFQNLKQAFPENATKGEVSTGATVGAAIGGLSAVALGAATGAVPLVIAGIAGAAGGSAMGGFVGIMTSQEVKNDFLNACHEQVLAGKILVAAEDHSDHAAENLSRAAQIFREEGSEMETLEQP